MKRIAFKGRTSELDDHGFLDPPEQWDEDFAEGMARLVGIVSGLTERHWQMIRYVRRKFLTRNSRSS
jgi:sulfur relay (sulfurtransferase) DsrC/TusE family protein